ncbi:MAG: type I restriction enzyme HsdR N-terminal domain-containing protein [Bacteroidota bacterium]
MLPQLNFPAYQFKTDFLSDHPRIWDNGRKKWLKLTPEEWVRQHWIAFLTTEKGYSASLIGAERSFKLNGLVKRFDILVGHPPLILVECKAPGIKINQDTLNQAIRYNMVLKVPYLVISNGLDHYVFKVDPENGSVEAIQELPGIIWYNGELKMDN